MARVLIIDDDPAILTVLGTSLRGQGYDVDTATAGAAGLSRAVIANPDVVILDLALPDLDGVDVCRRFRTWTEVPIVVLSAQATEARKVEALDAGADDFVTKPFGMAELEARLRVALRHGARRAVAEEAPVLLGTFDSPPENPLAGFMRAAAFTPFTPPFNVTGQPAISLPLGWTADGLPIGVQLVAAYGREDVLLRVAAQLELEHPWANRRPPLGVGG